MPVNETFFKKLITELAPGIQLVAVSKSKSAADIRALYDLGQRDFGENYVQELLEKREQLPDDIRWHFIGHLQSNKTKLITSFIHLIQTVDSLKLLKEIHQQAVRAGRVVDCLLQLQIASEDTKFGMNEEDLTGLVTYVQEHAPEFSAVRIRGLMGMATFTPDTGRIRQEFRQILTLSRRLIFPGVERPILSYGMSGDYRIALEEGSNLIRIGSLLFGERSG